MKREKFFKQNFVGFIIGGIIFGTLGVYAAITFPSNEVSFDPSNSTLKSTDVQGAIDELYAECTYFPTGGEAILENTDIVTSGDGLYADEYEDGRYFYKGTNPNNYITFNGEKAGWRIISIEKDGTIKIMKIADINTSNNLVWNSTKLNNWARPATLNTYLNGTYLSGLSSTAQNQIVAKDFSIGTVTYNNSNLENQINDENSKKWNGKIALPTVSEYLRTNSNVSCKTFSTYNSNCNTCKNTTWMYASNINCWWTLTPIANHYIVFDIYSSGDIGNFEVDVSNRAVRPTLYLSQDIKITGGTGTESDPYTISL